MLIVVGAMSSAFLMGLVAMFAFIFSSENGTRGLTGYWGYEITFTCVMITLLYNISIPAAIVISVVMGIISLNVYLAWTR